MIQPGSNFAAFVGAMLVSAFIVSLIRAALLMTQGFEQGFGVRQKSDSQSFFSWMDKGALGAT
jgi:hypothetical protein